MSKQPKALRLADCFERGNYNHEDVTKAAAELRRLHQVELAFNTWLEKTEWVQHTAEPGELGLHRADVLRQRIEELTEELMVMQEMDNG